MTRRAPLIVIGVGVVLILAMVVGLILPKISQVHASEKKVADAQAQQSVLEGQLAQLKATAAEAQQIRQRLAKLDAAVPPTTDLPGLIRLLNDIADQSAVDFMSVSPSQPTQGTTSGTAPPASPGASPSPVASAPPVFVPPPGISIIPVAIVVTGGYFAVDQYLFRLETLPRISKVLQIGLTPGQAGTTGLTLTLSVDFFTTDVNAGPGSEPGSQTSGGSGVAPPVPTATPPTGTTPSGSPSPTSSIQPG